MALYGILKTSGNTGQNSELQAIFSTPLRIISNAPAFVSDTVSLKRRTNSQGVQRWEIEAAMMLENNSADFLAHNVRYNFTRTIYIRMPQPYRSTGRFAAGLTVRANGGISTGSETISIKGVGALLPPVGEFITFTGSSKVYCITSATIPVGGVSTVTVHPKMLSTVADNTIVVTGDSVTMLARYDSDNVLGVTYRDGMLADPGTFKFVEEL